MKKKLLKMALVMSLLVTTIGACGKNAKNDSTASGQEYKYGTVEIPALDGSLCGAPIYIAYEKGFFAEEGIDAKLTSADFETRKIGLNNGTIPIVNGDFQFFSSVEQGIAMKVIGGMHYGCIKLVVASDSPLLKDNLSASDLENLKIGVDEVGGTTYQVASIWLEEQGVSAKPEDGEATFLPYSDGNLELEALYSGDIDIAAVWDPLGDIAVASGKAEVLVDISTDEPFAGKYCCFYYASEKVLNENPEEVKALYTALLKAQEWINENPEEALDIIEKGNYSEIEDKELAAKLITDYQYETIDSDHDVKEDILYFAEELKNIGYLESDPQEFTDKLYFKL
ncbi:MAG: ABC transporter substrate-binding protein [Lachnospiraceae bacterium]|nr:ABC transporter substrate-binding protein [Lachnospiraceae bacterium]